jgi:hypothetical protein
MEIDNRAVVGMENDDMALNPAVELNPIIASASSEDGFEQVTAASMTDGLIARPEVPTEYLEFAQTLHALGPEVAKIMVCIHTPIYIGVPRLINV